MTPITILVGSMTGNTEFAAEDMQVVLRDEYGCEARLLLMEDLGPQVFGKGGVFLICVSTYGEGDLPEPAQALYRALAEQRPDLSRIRYGVFGLGDSNYRDTFNFGGKRFDELLCALGATRLGERAKHDAQSGIAPEEYGRDWIRAWYANVRKLINGV